METILVIDDTATNIQILVELLDDTYDVIVATDGRTALEIADEELPDLILLDIIMPFMDGFEVCKQLKENPKTKNIPIIFLTAQTDEESIEKAYEVGGNDYVLKPLKPKELMARVKTQLELQRSIKNLEYLSSYDSMTGILNRRKFFELAKISFETKKEDLFAVMIDIDNFKNINDVHGHAAGDIVIKTIVSKIADMLPEESIFARLGGEEFVIVCNYEDEKKLFDLLEEIRNSIKDLTLNIENHLIRFTISMGIAQYKETFVIIDDLLKEADAMLYKAKETGRDKVIFRT
ncbi:MAG: diguanylate cyclase [Helicobacteraceae bacterium]|nr:diguanylate cyclase [Helicobacteraceae bacterium]